LVPGAIDYALNPDNAKKVYEASRAAGFVPLVTQVSLSRMTETPPP
jgi:endo-alpha-1,4-polygalactosaminidase (GH114 family)